MIEKLIIKDLMHHVKTHLCALNRRSEHVDFVADVLKGSAASVFIAAAHLVGRNTIVPVSLDAATANALFCEGQTDGMKFLSSSTSMVGVVF